MVSRFMICRSRFMVGGFRSLVFGLVISRSRCRFLISRLRFRFVGRFRLFVFRLRLFVFGLRLFVFGLGFMIGGCGSGIRRFRVFVAMIEDSERLRMTIRGSMVSRFMIGGFMISRGGFMIGRFRSLILGFSIHRSWSISRFGFRSIRGFRFSGFYISRLRFFIGWLRLMIGRFRGIRRFRGGMLMNLVLVGIL